MSQSSKKKKNTVLPNLRSVLEISMREREWSYDDLSHSSGIARSSLFAWTNGSAIPSSAAWAELAGALNADPVKLWEASGGTLGGPVWAGRMRRGWSQATLAKKAGVSFRTVSAAERGRQIRNDAASRLRNALGLTATLS